jgi:exonuclease III
MTTDYEGLDFLTYRGTGTAIIYSQDVAIYMQGIKDQPKKQGALTTVRLSLAKQKILVGSVYIPSNQKKKKAVYTTLIKLKKELEINEPETKLILLGDWNDKMDPLMDRDHGLEEDDPDYAQTSRKPTHKQLERLTSKSINMEPLIDIFRELQPSTKEYTHNAGSGAKARLDFSLISENARPIITSATISPHPINIRYHHNPIEVGIDLNITNLKIRETKEKQRNNKLRINLRQYRVKQYDKELTKLIDEDSEINEIFTTFEHPNIIEDPKIQLNQMGKNFTTAISRIATAFQNNIKQEAYTEKLHYDRTWLEAVINKFNPEEDVLDQELEFALNRTYDTYKKEGDPPAESLNRRKNHSCQIWTRLPCAEHKTTYQEK